MAGLVEGYDEEFVTELYRIFLGRDPDPVGLAHYLAALKSGLAPHDIISAFLNSSEFVYRSRGVPQVDLSTPVGRGQLDDRLLRVERLAHGGRAVYVGNNRILTKVSLGVWNLGFLLEADDLLLAPHLVIDGYHEFDLTNFFIRNLEMNDNCLDVGANFGYFTCVMARWSTRGKTIAVEPDRKIFELLRDNIHINSLEATASARNAAACDEPRELKLYRRVTRSGNTSITKVPDEWLAGMGEPHSVPFDIAGIPVDSLLPEYNGRLDFMKVDVEGAEPLVFRGARSIIEGNPQIRIVMEWSPGQISNAGFELRGFTDELSSLGLTPRMITAETAEPISWAELLELSYAAGILLVRS